MRLKWRQYSGEHLGYPRELPILLRKLYSESVVGISVATAPKEGSRIVTAWKTVTILLAIFCLGGVVAVDLKAIKTSFVCVYIPSE